MRRYDQVWGVLWIILGLSLCFGSIRLGLGNLSQPGPGFMPFLSGVFLALLAAPLMFSRTRNATSQERKIWAKGNWKNFFLPLFILLGYASVLERVGFLIAAFVFLFLLFKFTAPEKLLVPFILAFCTVVLSYLVFSVWLNCQLPKGILGF